MFVSPVTRFIDGALEPIVASAKYWKLLGLDFCHDLSSSLCLQKVSLVTIFCFCNLMFNCVHETPIVLWCNKSACAQIRLWQKSWPSSFWIMPTHQLAQVCYPSVAEREQCWWLCCVLWPHPPSPGGGGEQGVMRPLGTGTRCYKHHSKHCMLFWFDFCVNHRTETPKTRQIHHYLSIFEILSPKYSVDYDLMDIFVVEEMSCKLSLHSEWPHSVKLHFKGTLIGFDRKVHNQEVWCECDMMGGKVMGAVVGKISIWCSSGIWKLKALTLTWITLPSPSPDLKQESELDLELDNSNSKIV